MKFSDFISLTALASTILTSNLIHAKTLKDRLMGCWKFVGTKDGKKLDEYYIDFDEDTVYFYYWVDKKFNYKKFPYELNGNSLFVDNFSEKKISILAAKSFIGDSLVVQDTKTSEAHAFIPSSVDYKAYIKRIERETQEEQEQQPIIYDSDEWVPITDNLELRVNKAYGKRIWYSELSRANGVTFDNLSAKDIEEISRRYVDVLIVNVTARGTTNEEAAIDLDWINIVYPCGCSPYTKDAGLLRIINGTDKITRKVTEYTSATFNVPYIIYTNIGGDFSEGIKVPEGILRIGTILNPNVQIEIGRFTK